VNTNLVVTPRPEERIAAMWAAANPDEFAEAKAAGNARTVRGILKHEDFDRHLTIPPHQLRQLVTARCFVLLFRVGKVKACNALRELPRR